MKKSKSYEERLSELMAIIEKFESGELSLEDSMKNYEQGIGICNELYKELNEVKGKIINLNEVEESE